MSGFGDDGREMPHDPTFDDGAIDAILAGQPRGNEFAALGSFVEDLRSAAEAVPTPSPALAAALASGISPKAAAPMPKWRKAKMKIKGFVAGLGVAGKLALGAGVACAATTGAGAAGVLPGPVQHAFSKAVSSVTPFEAPGSDEHTIAEPAHDSTTTTTFTHENTTTTVESHDGDGSKSDDGDGNGVIVTPTTRVEHHDGTGEHETTPTTMHNGDGEHETTPTTVHNGDGDGEHHDDGDGEHSTTTTTVHHENSNPQSMTLSCTPFADPKHVECSWTADDNDAHVVYKLIRSRDGHGQVMYSGNDLSFSDSLLDVGVQYTYLVISLDSNGEHPTVLAHSNTVTRFCCGE